MNNVPMYDRLQQYVRNVSVKLSDFAASLVPRGGLEQLAVQGAYQMPTQPKDSNLMYMAGHGKETIVRINGKLKAPEDKRVGDVTLRYLGPNQVGVVRDHEIIYELHYKDRNTGKERELGGYVHQALRTRINGLVPANEKSIAQFLKSARDYDTRISESKQSRR